MSVSTVTVYTMTLYTVTVYTVSARIMHMVNVQRPIVLPTTQKQEFSSGISGKIGMFECGNGECAR